MIKLAENLIIPEAEAATQKFAFLGSNGSGKSYAATKLGEEMLRAGIQMIAIDPIGIWHGLRRKADGTPSDFNVLVFGGLHGDLPLMLSMAKAISHLVVSERLSVVLDLKLLRRSERKTFAATFADEFHHLKAHHKSPVHLFLEEAQNFVPQRLRSGDRDETLAAFYAISTEGRNDGIGITLISPSPQDVDKRVLNLSQCLFAFRLTGPQEREAVQKWIQETSITALLPKLEVGQPYVWSPGWLKQSGIVKIELKQSYDSSKSPSVQTLVELPKLPDVDLETVRAFLEQFVEDTELRSITTAQTQITQLKRENAALKSQLQSQPQIERIKVPILRQGELDQLRDFVAQLAQVSEQTSEIAQSISAQILKCLALNETAATRPYSSDQSDSTSAKAVQSLPQHLPSPPKQDENANTDDQQPQSEVTLPNIQQRILNAIAFFQQVGIPQPRRNNVAIFCGLSATAGYFKNNVSNLRQKGLLDYPNTESMQLTEAGNEIAKVDVQFQSNAQLHELWFKTLPNIQVKLLQILIQHYPDAISRQDLADAVSLSVTAGYFKNNLSALRSLAIVDYPDTKSAIATDLLFPLKKRSITLR